LAPIAIGRVAMLMPNIPVLLQRAMMEKVMRATLPQGGMAMEHLFHELALMEQMIDQR
jgi:hypothetical protein